MRVRVECYSGYRANERPVCFYLGEQPYRVSELLDRWYSPGKLYFRVRADDGNIYILGHNEAEEDDSWTLESFRREHRTGREKPVEPVPDSPDSKGERTRETIRWMRKDKRA